MSMTSNEMSTTQARSVHSEVRWHASRRVVKSSFVSFATGAAIVVGGVSPASGVASAPLMRLGSPSASEWTVWESPFAAITSNTFSVRSTAEMVGALHAQSGLTWEQLARAIGVSRRSLHLWAAGAKVSSVNQERVARLYAVMSELPAVSPDEKRALFFAHRPGVPSIYDEVVNSTSRRGVQPMTAPVRALGVENA